VVPDFVSLPIKDGVGAVHLNRFRISMYPLSRDAGTVARIGRELFGAMAKYMDSRTAAVEVDSHTWNGDKTLRFRGVAMFRPFISIPLPLVLTTALSFMPTVTIPIPDSVRDLMIPDVHTDSVGAAFKGPTSFTAQTLKRQFETTDDLKIRAVIKSTVVPAIMVQITNNPLLMGLTGLMTWLSNNLADKVGDIAVDINQHHFLAGRRSFHFDEGSVFGYDDGRLVFETAAVERYSLTTYKLATDIGMGSAADVVRPVWVQMCRRVATENAMRIVVETPQHGWKKEQEVHYIQEQLADISKVTSNAQWSDMNRLHPQVLDPKAEASS
jgi:hypothetical protein